MDHNKDKKELSPFLKWAGGKRWFVKKHLSLLPDNYNTYLEPFLGSGALFFKLQPEKAIINDVNPKLINVYKAIKLNPSGITERLKNHQNLHSKEYYYSVRKQDIYDLIDQAAQFIYLNRTCFNGIYRVNLKGEFNVPIGTKTQVLLENDDFFKISECLSKVNILNEDFETVIELAQEGDFIFIDPPYTVSHNNNGFVKYNENLFSWNDQIRLYESLKRAHVKKVQILCTNANHQSLHDLYKEEYFSKTVVSRFSSISGKNSSRSQYEEIIIRNYK